MINNEVLLEAIRLYETDFMDTQNESEFGEQRKIFSLIEEAYYCLRNSGEIKYDINIGAVLKIIDYYLKIRKEDYESGDIEQIEYCNKIIPIAKKMYDRLKEIKKS